MVKIDSLSFGAIGIDGEKYRVRDVLIFPDGTVQRRKLDRWVTKHHRMGEEDISVLVMAGAQTVVIGIGKFSGVKLSDSVRSYAQQTELELVELPSCEVVGKFNQLVDSGEKKVGGLIHLMC